MLEPKAVIKRTRFSLVYLTVGVGLALLSSSLWVPTAEAKKEEKTVGDVLKKIEKTRLKIQKGSASLPKFQAMEARKQVNLRAVKPLRPRHYTMRKAPMKRP